MYFKKLDPRLLLNTLLMLLVGLLCSTQSVAATDRNANPVCKSFKNNIRVIVSTDFPPLDVIPIKGAKDGDPRDKISDPDDVQSMVRFLLYSNEFEIEGLIATAGTLADVARKQNILNMLSLYDQVDENLRAHDCRYPTADKLRAVTWEGRSDTWGSPSFGTPGKPLGDLLGQKIDSEASDAIFKLLLNPDPRPLWVLSWGGSRELAQAIWKIRDTRSQADLTRAIKKLRVYLIAKQDNTSQWLLDTFPDLFIILSEKNYMGMFMNAQGSNQDVANLAWVNEHLRKGHGPLGAAYPSSGWDPATPGVWEGDSPSFLYLISALRGVSDAEKPNQPSWGGQFVQTDPSKNHWFDDSVGMQTVFRWRKDFQEEFAARAEWMKPKQK